MLHSSIKTREWRARNPAKYLRNHLRRYNLSLEDYQTMLRLQGGTCAICFSPCPEGRLCVDHDHTTGLLRGLLCRACNRALGGFNEDPELLRRAAEYLHWELVKP